MLSQSGSYTDGGTIGPVREIGGFLSRTVSAFVVASLTAACTAGLLGAQEAGFSGEALFRTACANCHGIDGTGAPASTVVFSEELPDFTDCSFATREPIADWAAIVHEGGPTRGFGRIMPAFGDALTDEEIERVLGYVRSFCGSTAWPRGELNLPRALVTEKAYPEDEAVVTTSSTIQGSGAVTSSLVYEHRIGARAQFEINVPVRAFDQGGGDWTAGIGDVAVGFKRAMFHSLSSGTIVSLTGEVVLPTGNMDKGLGKGTVVFEPFLTIGQILPADFFVHTQVGVELPTDRSRATREAFFRGVLGRSFTQGRFGRAWSPMVEVLGARELVSGEAVQWDLLPEMQVTLSRRQHIMVNAGFRFPLTDAGSRSTEFLFYLLWDWFDGGLASGW
jgi:mono/diheme cytochrome c family protein